ncbi:MAG: hypothetical protein NVSMB13_14810 [Mycobacteriales bacterium]
MGIIVLVIIGLIVGALGRLIVPGRTPLPIWLTILIGVGSFLLAGLVINAQAHLILAIVVGAVIAALLIVVVGRLGARNSRV